MVCVQVCLWHNDNVNLRLKIKKHGHKNSNFLLFFGLGQHCNSKILTKSSFCPCCVVGDKSEHSVTVKTRNKGYKSSSRKKLGSSLQTLFLDEYLYHIRNNTFHTDRSKPSKGGNNMY